MKHPFFQPIGALSGWDVVAALVGLGATLAVLSLQPAAWSYRLLWLGGPSTFILARRHFLPQLSPARTAPAAPLTAARRVLGFVLMIGGGFVGLFSGIIAGVCVSVGGHAWDDALAVAASMGVFAGAVWVVVLGMRVAG